MSDTEYQIVDLILDQYGHLLAATALTEPGRNRVIFREVRTGS